MKASLRWLVWTLAIPPIASCAAPQPDVDALPVAHDGGTWMEAGQEAGDASVGPCVPLTCSALSAHCGSAPDGCGGKVDCGPCPQGQTCGGGGPNVCGTAPCSPKSCSDVGAQCGHPSDGCSAVLSCGTCVGGQSCNPQFQCTCVTKTCSELGLECGTASDGCNGTLHCGECSSPLVCGGGGPNKCGQAACVPKTCAGEGISCGSLSDGCGTMLACGTCSSPTTCGGGGVSGQCGCTPTTCKIQGKECGTIPDGCGGTLDCGTCTGGKQCGAGGLPNQCACVPTSCSAQGFNCGTIPDGCGTTLDCGSCTAPKLCGGSGKSNVCGCNPTACPPFYDNGFELDTDFPAGWTVWHNCAADTDWFVQRDIYPAPTGGSWNLRLHTTAFQASCDWPGAYAASPPLPAQAGKTYRIETWSRNGGALGVTSILFRNASSTEIGYGEVFWTTDAWEYGADPPLVAIAPPGTVDFIVRFGLQAASTYADLDLLKVYLEP